MYVNPLHRARLGSGITLTQVSARTCLSPRIVQLIDGGHFSQLPGGLYARSYVRSFAAVVGLDPEAAIAELSEQLPPDEDPIPALRESARARLPAWVRTVADWTQAVKTRLTARTAQHEPSPSRAAQWRRVMAAGVEIVVLVLCYAGLIGLTSWMARVDFRTGLDIAGLPVGILCSVLAILYLALLGGIGGRTLGGVICRLPPSAPGTPLGLRDIWLRARSAF